MDVITHKNFLKIREGNECGLTFQFYGEECTEGDGQWVSGERGQKINQCHRLVPVNYVEAEATGKQGFA